MSWLDLTNDEVQTNTPVPAGKYNVAVETAEVKDTKSGTGQYISVMFNILTGEHEGRKVFNMYNIKNANPKAVEIGRAQLKSLMLAAGKTDTKLGGVSELEGLRCSITTKVVTDDYGEKAVVKGHFEPTEDLSTTGQPSTSGFASDDIPF